MILFFKNTPQCNTVLEIDPNNIKGLYRRGQSYAAMSDFETALEDFQRVSIGHISSQESCYELF